MKNKLFIFNQKRLTVEINKDLKNILNRYRQTNREDNERGGALMGELYPDSNIIKITHIIKCKNKRESRYSIKLDAKCLSRKINKIWRESKGKITYLGDWHTHPEKLPKPSFDDIITFSGNFYGSKFDQNILIYLILGTEQTDWMKSFNGFKYKSVHS